MKTYLNGYYQALQLDIEEINELKKDEQILKKKVMEAEEKYGTIIDRMNPSKKNK